MDREKFPMAWPVSEEPRSNDDWKFYIEAIKSWRAWRVIELDGVLVLQSITFKSNWIPRQELIAECIPSRACPAPKIRHAAPDIDHGCGIYSLKDKEDAVVWSKDYPTETETIVYGEVFIWGHVFVFTKGYLSEYAYPANLIIPSGNGTLLDELGMDQLQLELSNTYQVEVVPEYDTSCR